MKTKYNEAKELLIKYNQKHIIEYLSKIEEEKQKEVINQILRIDFDEIVMLCNNSHKKANIKVKDLQPIQAVNPNKIPKEQLKEYVTIGENIIKEKKYALATMAGGQGTRLRA